MYDTPIVSFELSSRDLDLRGLPVLVDTDEAEAVHISVENLVSDLERVTGHRSPLWTEIPADQPPIEGIIVVGCLDNSKFLSKLPTSSMAENIRGKWESFSTELRVSPWTCAKRVFVIAGSDKRGTVFGVYNLCEQIGVSPWYWWADVPVRHLDHVYALPISTWQGEPSVQYRGLFINDETPALADWVHEKFGPVFNTEFYKKFFELLLRMKANFFWPAMWSGFPEPGSSFFADDPENQLTADRCGVVVSTSHHEPMQRSTTEWRRDGKGPWAWESNKENITSFFEAGAVRSKPYESLFTLGMRGEGDQMIESINPKATLTDVIKTQRRVIQDVYGKPDGVGQVMALYKEVQQQYEEGLEVPKDVTLLFADDNFGNLRRLPTTEEFKRPGGCGVYYHFEYVGSPRGYKWINTNSCGKIQHELQTAYKHGIRKIWIFNVGDIKPMENPITLAMSLAWNINNFGSVEEYLKQYATREFGPDHADEISGLLSGHDRLMALRRHEHVEPDTFSILNYREADTILERYHDLESRANALFRNLSTEYKAAFFQLVLHPIKASRIYTDLRITQSKNRLYGQQRRNSTNLKAKRALELFDEDWILAEQYHNNPWSGTKWNHIMKQPHYGYDSSTWHDPSRDMIAGLSFVQRRQNSSLITGQMGVAVEGHPGVRPGLINEESDRMQPSRGELAIGLTLPPLSPYGDQRRYFEIFSRGTSDLEWSASISQPWLLLSQESGRLSPDEADHRVELKVDWTQVPNDFDDELSIDISSNDGSFEQVHVPVLNRKAPESFHGFVEADGHVSIEPGAIPLSPAQQEQYVHRPSLGRTLSGTVSLNLSVLEGNFPWLEYSTLFFSTPERVTIRLYFTMVLDAWPGESLTYEISLDDFLESVTLLRTVKKGDLPVGWSTSVQDLVWIREHTFPGITTRGIHQVRFRPLSPGIAIEKLVIDLGGVRDSYLGPPPSSFV